jgi:hypothetical protein
MSAQSYLNSPSFEFNQVSVFNENINILNGYGLLFKGPTGPGEIAFVNPAGSITNSIGVKEGTGKLVISGAQLTAPSIFQTGSLTTSSSAQLTNVNFAGPFAPGVTPVVVITQVSPQLGSLNFTIQSVTNVGFVINSNVTSGPVWPTSGINFIATNITNTI